MITLVRSYQPYGEVLSSSGSGESRYSFTGEWADASGLIFLRARFYSPWDGRFLSQDVWDGDYSQPISYNGWLYGYANPVMMTDPSGMVPLPEDPCGRLPYPEQEVCRDALCKLSQDICSSRRPFPDYSTYSNAKGRGKLFINLLRNCPGWWQHRYGLNTEMNAVKSALVLAYYWESNSHNVDQPDALHNAMGEAYAHKYWQGIISEGGFPDGVYWLLGGRESMNRRLAQHYRFNFGGFTGNDTTFQRFDLRNDIDVPSTHTSFIVVDNIWNKYHNQPGISNNRYWNRPYEWGNPSRDWNFLTHILDKEVVQGTCPNNVFYTSAIGVVKEKDFCVVTYEQQECLSGNQFMCARPCSESQ